MLLRILLPWCTKKNTCKLVNHHVVRTLMGESLNRLLWCWGIVFPGRSWCGRGQLYSDITTTPYLQQRTVPWHQYIRFSHLMHCWSNRDCYLYTNQWWGHSIWLLGCQVNDHCWGTGTLLPMSGNIELWWWRLSQICSCQSKAFQTSPADEWETETSGWLQQSHLATRVKKSLTGLRLHSKFFDLFQWQLLSYNRMFSIWDE